MKKIHFEHINSTSSYLKENYDKYDNLTFVSADYQENGRGRNGRVWSSEEGENLLFSILIKDEVLFNKTSDLSLSSAVCVYKCLKKFNIDDVSIKWPNDVYIKGKKISGILLESVSCGKGIEALIIGVGINVNSEKFTNDLINEPTSMCLELGKKIDLDEIRQVIYNEFIVMINDIKNDKRNYLKIVRDNNYLKGKKVYALIDNKRELVEVIDINDDNSLKVYVNSNYLNVYSGEVTFHV